MSREGCGKDRFKCRRREVKMDINTAAQALSIVGMVLNILSYQSKSKNGILIMQLIGSVFFSASFFMLNAPVGAMMNAVAIARAIVYANGERLHSDNPVWLYGFIAVYSAIYAASFLVFKTEPIFKNFALELLPVLAMSVATYSYMVGNAKVVRLFSFISSPLWLTYNIFNLSIGGIVTESVALISITVGLLRYDLKKRGAENDKAES